MAVGARSARFRHRRATNRVHRRELARRRALADARRVGMKIQEREKQAVSLVAGLALMFAIAFGPILLITHRGPWTPGAITIGAGIGGAGLFALAVLFRAQKLGSDESIFSGRFGLVVAVLGVLLLLAFEGLGIWALGDERSPVREDRTVWGLVAGLVGIGYLGRAIHRNLTGAPLVPPPAVAPSPAPRDEDDDE